jgi:hypothetical protein
MVNVFLGLPTTTGPLYTNDKSNTAAIDPNLLYIITVATFIRDNPDAPDRFAQSVEDALAWVERRADNILIEEAPYAAWDDALKKHGVTAYTNVLYAAALQTMSEAFDEPTYAERARVVERRLRSALWTGSYYKAWGERDVCDVAANLLAVLFDIGPAEHHRSILNFLDTEQRANNDVLYKTNYPSYPWHDTYLPFHLVGMSDYHNSGPYWTWITALETLARDQLQTTPGDNADRLDTIIQDHGDIAEILNEHREPVRRVFYQSEQRFTWTAGLLLAHTTK